MDSDTQDSTSGNKPERDALGKLLPGNTANPFGRPKGSLSIKDAIRKELEANPEAVKEIVKHFIEKNRELMWTMLEGSPKSTTENKSTNIEIDITGADLLLAQQLLEQRRAETNGTEGNGTDSEPLDREV